MADQAGEETDQEPFAVPTRGDELRTFLLLTVVLAPLITVICIGGFGFLIWMTQLILGPPSY